MVLEIHPLAIQKVCNPCPTECILVQYQTKDADLQLMSWPPGMSIGYWFLKLITKIQMVLGTEINLLYSQVEGMILFQVHRFLRMSNLMVVLEIPVITS